MRKRQLQILMLVLTLGILVGSVQATSLNLAMWEGAQTDFAAWDRVINRFLETHPHIFEVNIQRMPYTEYREAMLLRLATGVGPDVFMIDYEFFAAHRESGFFLDLAKYGEEMGLLEQYIPVALAGYGYTQPGDPLWGVPNDLGTYVMYYNSDLFAEAGLVAPDAQTDWSYDDVARTAQRLTAVNPDGRAEQYGFWVHVEDWKGLIPLIRAFGGNLFEVVDGKTHILIDSPESIAALEWAYYVVMELGIAPPIPQVWRDFDFVKGRIGMKVDGTWWIGTYLRQDLDFNWSVTHIPRQKQRVAPANGVAFAVNVDTKEPEAAMELAFWLTQNEALDNLRQPNSPLIAAYIPYNIYQLESEQSPIMHLWAEAVQTYAEPGVQHPFILDLSREWRTHLSPAYIEGRVSIQEAAGQLAGIWRQIVQ